MNTTIKLIAKDFDSLTKDCGTHGTGQYVRQKDCPIYRALKRQGYNVRSVEPGAAFLDDGVELKGEFYYSKVEQCRKQILDGAKYGEIQIYKNDN